MPAFFLERHFPMGIDKDDYNNSDFFRAAKISSMRDWQLTGCNQIVKVTNFLPNKDPKTGKASLSGYITQAKFLYGQTPAEITGLLGLPPAKLSGGCHIHSFARMPKPEEVAFRFSCIFPAGLPATDAVKTAWLEYKNGKVEVFEGYPPGSVMVPQ